MCNKSVLMWMTFFLNVESWKSSQRLFWMLVTRSFRECLGLCGRLISRSTGCSSKLDALYTGSGYADLATSWLVCKFEHNGCFLDCCISVILFCSFFLPPDADKESTLTVCISSWTVGWDLLFSYQRERRSWSESTVVENWSDSLRF